MKKFFSISLATLVATTVISSSASAACVNKIQAGVIKGEAAADCVTNIKDIICNKFGQSDFQIIYPGFGCDAPSIDTDIIIPTPDSGTQTPDTDVIIPEQGGNTSGGETEESVPEQDTDTPSVESSLHAYEREVIRLVNEIRAQNGLASLATDEELSRVARIKSQDMKDNNYFSHTSPVYGSPFDMMKNFGISYKSAAENIAKGQSTPAEVVDAWMNSSGHRANILNASYNAIGVGYVADGNYWTQMFIGR